MKFICTHPLTLHYSSHVGTHEIISTEFDKDLTMKLFAAQNSSERLFRKTSQNCTYKVWMFEVDFISQSQVSYSPTWISSLEEQLLMENLSLFLILCNISNRMVVWGPWLRIVSSSRKPRKIINLNLGHLFEILVKDWWNRDIYSKNNQDVQLHSKSLITV